MDDDRTRWDERYRGSDWPRPGLPRLVLLDEGCSPSCPDRAWRSTSRAAPGAQSLWLADRGLRGGALDVSPVAIELTDGGRAAGRPRPIDRRAGPRPRRRTARPTSPMSTSSSANDSADPNLYPQIAAALRPGGLAVVTVLSAVGLDGEPGPFHAPPENCATPSRRTDIEILRDVEADGLASIVLPRR